MKRLLIFFSISILNLFYLCAQTNVITGTVTSVVPGEGPIPGVTVQVKGTSIGTTTDESGKYTLNVPTNATTLVFSFVGMKRQEIEIGEKLQINVFMESDILALDEIIVTTAYGIKRTPKGSSAFNQVISGEKVNEVRPANISSALAGKVSGIQFHGQSNVKLNSSSPYLSLRGGSGFSTGSKAIFVVDGTILPASNDINLDDIDNISVLSGPAAAAIFGSQGADGAVVIETKKAKARAGKPMGVEMNSGFLASHVYILPNFQNDYAGGNSYDMYRYDYRDSDPVEWQPLNGKYHPDYSDDGNWGPRMAGQDYIPWYAWYPGTKYTGKTAKLVPQPDNIRNFFNTGSTFNNSVAFNKTGEAFNIRLVIGNNKITGSLPNSSVDKTSLNLKASYDINRKLTVAANVNFYTALTRGYYNDDYGNPATGAFNSWFHRDLDPAIFRELKDLRSPVGSIASWNHNNPVSYNPDNPLLFYGALYTMNFYSVYDLVKRSERSDRLFGDVSLAYKIFDGFDLKITYRRQENNRWTEIINYSDIGESYYDALSSLSYGYYGTGLAYSNRENYETLLSFNRKIGNFTINTDAGSDFFSDLSRNNSANTVNGLNVRNLFSISNSKDQPSISARRLLEKYRAIFFKADFGFRDYIFFDFTVRNDWFSTLPALNNSVLSKSFGGSFVFSDILKIPWLNFGKIRCSWGEIPTAIGAYVYPGFSYTVKQYQWDDNFLMTTPNTIVDPEIRGAVKTQKEIGMELRLLNNRTGFSITYWDGTEKDIPYTISVAGQTGFSSKLLNTGKISKQGIDIALNFRPFNTLNFTWESNSTFSWLIKNKVVRIAEGVDRFVAQKTSVFGTPDMVHAEGRTWGELFGSGMKMHNGKPELNADGSYVSDPEKYFGNVLPKYTGGFQNYFRVFKQFTLTASIDYQFGGKFFSLSNMWGTFSGLTARTSGLNDRGIPVRDPVVDGGGVHVFGADATTLEGVDYYIDAYTYFHSFRNNDIYDPFVYDLSYIKFRELSIGYDIPIGKSTFLRKNIESANIALIAQNFWLIYADSFDFDPSETSYISGEQAQFPGIRSIGLNLKLSF